MALYSLRAGGLAVDVLPSLGGAVTRFTAGEFPVFRVTPDAPAGVSDTSSFPLMPFSNRVRAGAFRFAGEDYRIPVDKRDPRFANHGYTRHLPWEVISAASDALLLRFVQAAPMAAWSFPFTAEQVFELAGDRLRMTARIRNDFAAPAPAGVGFHPYFTRLPGTVLRFAAARVWETDALDIPLRSLPPVEKFDFAKGKMLEAPPINHAYGGWDGEAEIIHPGGVQLDIRGAGAFDHLILFTPAGKNFFGFEPVSHRPDALNPLPDARDKGMTILAPGEWLEGRMEITVIQ